MTVKGKWQPLSIDEKKVGYADYLEGGCPQCGEKECYPLIQTVQSAVVNCANCNLGYEVVFEVEPDEGPTPAGFVVAKLGAGEEPPDIMLHICPLCRCSPCTCGFW